jgi:D-galactose 1-dehydrogenase
MKHSVPLAIVGLGKIARDQHLPAIASSEEFALAGIASPCDALPNVPSAPELSALLEAVPDLAAVALCTPPQVRYSIARYAIERGLHVLLEKPPCATLSEAQDLIDRARARGVTLLFAWHSRFAPAVGPAQTWVRAQNLRSVTVSWREDVRVWHPGQAWIWRAGGQGVFDPGINALSILTRILPERLTVQGAELRFPEGSDTPIAAHLAMRTSSGTSVVAELDFLHPEEPQWQIQLISDSAQCFMSQGGSALTIDGRAVPLEPSAEYLLIYRHFAQLIRRRAIDADLSPLQLVADAYLSGQRTTVEAFKD